MKKETILAVILFCFAVIIFSSGCSVTEEEIEGYLVNQTDAECTERNPDPAYPELEPGCFIECPEGYVEAGICETLTPNVRTRPSRGGGSSGSRTPAITTAPSGASDAKIEVPSEFGKDYTSTEGREIIHEKEYDPSDREVIKEFNDPINEEDLKLVTGDVVRGKGQIQGLNPTLNIALNYITGAITGRATGQYKWCRPKTCEDYEGHACEGQEVCYSNWINVPGDDNCCETECVLECGLLPPGEMGGMFGSSAMPMTDMDYSAYQNIEDERTRFEMWAYDLKASGARSMCLPECFDFKYLCEGPQYPSEWCEHCSGFNSPMCCIYCPPGTEFRDGTCQEPDPAGSCEAVTGLPYSDTLSHGGHEGFSACRHECEDIYLGEGEQWTSQEVSEGNHWCTVNSCGTDFQRNQKCCAYSPPGHTYSESEKDIVPDHEVEGDIEATLECPWLKLAWPPAHDAASYSIIMFYDKNQDGNPDGKCDDDIFETSRTRHEINLMRTACVEHLSGSVMVQVVPQASAGGPSLFSYDTEWIDVSVCNLVPPEPEICYDGIDNTGNGLIDCEDPECIGQICNDEGWRCIRGECQEYFVSCVDRCHLPQCEGRICDIENGWRCANNTCSPGEDEIYYSCIDRCDVEQCDGRICGFDEVWLRCQDGECLPQPHDLLNAKVIDNSTGEPVENAIVYLSRRAHWMCRTDHEGHCIIRDFVSDYYILGAFKLGYERFTESVFLEKGSNNITIELEKKEDFPESQLLKGKIIEIINNKGTSSENIFYRINETVLFDYIGQSRGFEDYINKTVRITGFEEYGFTGWPQVETLGIYVEEIEVI